MTIGRSPWLGRAGITAFFTALTAIMTWPQAAVLATHATEHHDVLFNMWRLRWFAHALATAPRRLFDGNVFYPERGVLAFSDAMPVEGLIAAPLLWIGVPPVLVHNLLLLGAIVASGAGMYVLARHLSGSRTGALAAGIVFSFAPYRFEHYMHMELQWAVWLPWAFWALQRTLENRSLAFGGLTGLFIALQMLSSVYYGVFLCLLLPIVAMLQLISREMRGRVQALRCLVAGAIIAGGISALYGVPYSRASSRVGQRSLAEVTSYSAKPRDYLAATQSNLLYGERAGQRTERRLFPGAIAALLALIGLLLVPPSAATVACVIGAVAAFELSLGVYGAVYPWLYQHLGLLQSLRVPARASIFCLLFLGVLAAQGCAALETSVAPRLRRLVGIVVIPAMLLEYWVAPLHLVPHHNAAPPLYAWLAQQPEGVVTEFPMPTPSSLPGPDPVYAYMSSFHWKPLVNGYSGYYPPSYIRQLTALAGFPDAAALSRLQQTGVRYVVVHDRGYSAAEYQRIAQRLLEAGLLPRGEFDDGGGKAVIFATR